MVHTTMEARLEALERMYQESMRDRDRAENEQHDGMQRLENMISGVTGVVEKNLLHKIKNGSQRMDHGGESWIF